MSRVHRQIWRYASQTILFVQVMLRAPVRLSCVKALEVWTSVSVLGSHLGFDELQYVLYIQSCSWKNALFWSRVGLDADTRHSLSEECLAQTSYGSSRLPSIGDALQLKEIQWLLFSAWIRSGASLLTCFLHYKLTSDAPQTDDMFYLNAAVQPILIINRHDIAADLLDRRGGYTPIGRQTSSAVRS